MSKVLGFLVAFFVSVGAAQTVNGVPNQAVGGVVAAVNGYNTQSVQLAASDVGAPKAGSSGNSYAITANNLISLNHHLFSDGTDGWCAGSVYCSYGEYGADILYTMTLYPGRFTPTQVLNTVNKFINAKNVSGDFPATVNWDGTPDFYCTPTYDLHCSHATGDGWMAVTQLTYLYWQKTGDLTPYRTNVAAVKTALARIPRNSGNHLITVTPGDEYVACSGFREQGRFTGDDACASVNYAIAAKEWAAMATAANDATNASFFTTEYTNVKASIASVLTDSGTQMLDGASIQNHQIDIMSTVQAVYNELLPSAQESAISDWLNTNYSSITHAGFVLEMAAPCTYWGHIPSSGGPPYDQSTGFNPSNSSYQCGGSWGFLSGWFAYALAKNHPAQAATFVANYLTNTTPGTEYFTGSSANGDPALLTAAQGQRNADEVYDPGFTAPSTVLCLLNPLGACMASAPSDGANGAGVPDINLPYISNTTITAVPPTFFSVGNHFAPNMVTGSHMLLPVGTAGSADNESYIAFVKAGGTNSPNNYGSVGMYGADDTITWFPNGNATVGYTTPQTQKLAVNGDVSAAAMLGANIAGNLPGISWAAGSGSLVAGSNAFNGAILMSATGAATFTLSWKNNGSTYSYPLSSGCVFNVQENGNTTWVHQTFGAPGSITANGSVTSGEYVNYICAGY